ncbi:MAG: HAMP domain-containing histidine kinase [Bacteroidia bacterium]|nr:HAMP domain-containing histidine kinase [Bacteroidia bacterium]MCZ2247574.1 HAMP domain-containing histidine kinase [Bacteroidia bacterium]
MMTILNREVHDLKLKLELSTLKSSDEISRAHIELNDRLHKKWLMIAGEGSVFVIILGLGIFRTHHTFKKEMELSRQQKNFMLSVTHELKSPIAATRLQIETLIRHQLPQAKQEIILKQALQETERLDMLVEKLLIANNIESSLYTLNKEQFNLSEWSKEIIARLNNSLLKNHTVITDIDDDILIHADPMALTSIVTNLLDNAAKYSKIGSPIVFSLKNERNHITLQFKDEGIGIVETDKNMIFNKFYRSGNEETRKTKGTGLGLYIVKNLVLLHRGQIDVKPNMPQGTIFTVKFNSI